MGKNNIVLIGMPGCGKSTVGVLLAKRIRKKFVDTDLFIQEQEERLLCEIIEEDGLERFKEIENEVNATVVTENSVIAPGGSVIYGARAMEHLREIGTIVYLKLTYEDLEKRLGNLKDRGVVLKDGMTLRDLYEERSAYYERYAEVTIDETGKEFGEVVDELRAYFENPGSK